MNLTAFASLASLPPAAATADPHVMLRTAGVALAAGVFLIILGRRINIPGIVMLLIGGVALGPMGLGVVEPESLGDGLRVIVALSVGLILFEGGLTLDVDGYRSAAVMIKRLLTIGIIVTWGGTTLIIRHVIGQDWPIAIVGASLVIVTGPTVIAPLLKRIKVNARLHGILHWEGVLIDPIGVFIAVLCFEWLSGSGGQTALVNLIVRVAAGLTIGAAGGVTLAWIVNRRFVSDEMVNVFAFALAVFIFVLGEAVRPETGLLSVTVAGFVFGAYSSSKLKAVRRFKAEITDLLIGTLFILLASRLEFDQFKAFGLKGAIAVALVMFMVRPVSIFLCSLGLDFNLREKAFLSWVSPRGIVAASMASLVAISLERAGEIEDPRFVETFTYSVITATIVIQGLTAGPLAGLLGLRRPAPTGWLIIGAHGFARRIAGFIEERAERHVVLVDTNARAVADAQGEGFTAFRVDARDRSLIQERGEVQGIGYVLALTDNEDLNVRVCQTWSEAVGADHVFRCNPSGSVHASIDEDPDEGSGHVVWPELPRPGLLAAELARGEATLIDVPASHKAYASVARTLLGAGSAAGVVFEPEDDEGGEGWRLYLQRRADYLARSLNAHLILSVEAKSLTELFGQLVDRVLTVKRDVPRDATVKELLERERAFPTALGHGVAVPHAYVDGLDARLCVIARVPGGIVFGDRDADEPVRLVFLLLSPPGDPEGHLATLADIARLVHSDEIRRKLMAAESPPEVMDVIRAGG